MCIGVFWIFDSAYMSKKPHKLMCLSSPLPICARTRTPARRHAHAHTHTGSTEKLLTGKIYYKNIHILTNIYNYIQSLVMTSYLSIPLNLSLSCTHQFTVNTHITGYSKNISLTACFHLFCTQVAVPSTADTLEHRKH